MISLRLCRRSCNHRNVTHAFRNKLELPQSSPPPSTQPQICNTLPFSTNTGAGVSRGPSEKEKEELLFSYLNKHSYKNNDEDNPYLTSNSGETDGAPHPDTSKSEDEKETQMKQFDNDKERLFQTAKTMTLSMYRTCIRCTKLMAHGNEHDETQFQLREEEQKSKRISGGPSFSMSFEPSVDRENELASRASYYMAFIKESFGQEVDCLTRNSLWREDDIYRFVHLMKQGEERRSWILKDYKFDDPYCDSWDDNIASKLDLWEKEATEYVQKIYKINGWLLKEDCETNFFDPVQDDSIDYDWDKDDIWDDSDENEFKNKQR